MSRGEFDSFLVRAKIGASRSLRRLTPAERWCFVAGVLAIAAESPIRGALLIAEGEPVTIAEIADEAAVTPAVAASAVKKLTRLHKLEHDDDLGCLIVVNWHQHQVEPKPSDTREAWRERKRRERERKRDGHANVPRDVTPLSRPEVEGEEKNVNTDSRDGALNENASSDPPALHALLREGTS